MAVAGQIAARHARARRVPVRSGLRFGKNHLGDHTYALPTAHGFPEYWGYLYHLDAMQGVASPTSTGHPIQQGFAPPCKNTNRTREIWQSGIIGGRRETYATVRL